MKKYTTVILAVVLAVAIAGCSTKSTKEQMYEVPVIDDVVIQCDGMDTKSSYSDCTHVKGRPTNYPY